MAQPHTARANRRHLDRGSVELLVDAGIVAATTTWTIGANDTHLHADPRCARIDTSASTRSGPTVDIGWEHTLCDCWTDAWFPGDDDPDRPGTVRTLTTQIGALTKLHHLVTGNVDDVLATAAWAAAAPNLAAGTRQVLARQLRASTASVRAELAAAVAPLHTWCDDAERVTVDAAAALDEAVRWTGHQPGSGQDTVYYAGCKVPADNPVTIPYWNGLADSGPWQYLFTLGHRAGGTTFHFGVLPTVVVDTLASSDELFGVVPIIPIADVDPADGPVPQDTFDTAAVLWRENHVLHGNAFDGPADAYQAAVLL